MSKYKILKVLGYKIKLDLKDYKVFSKMTWNIKNGYAKHCARINNKTVNRFMHRIIVGNVPKNKQVDHINRDRLDNRRSNLRIVSRSQNQFNSGKPKRNTSGYKGVSWNKQWKVWNVSMRKRYKTYWFGYYKNKKIAAYVWNLGAQVLHGEFAYQNKVSIPRRDAEQARDKIAEFVKTLWK